MAKKQYRICTRGEGLSSWGNAVLLLQNVSGSGRKITLRDVEVQVQSVYAGAGQIERGLCRLWTGTSPCSGEDVTDRNVRLDTGTSLPSTVKVRRYGGPPAFTSVLKQMDLTRKATGTAGMLANWCFQMSNLGSNKFPGGGWGQTNKRSTVEAVTIPQDKSISVMNDLTIGSTAFAGNVKVNLLLSINGKSVHWEFNSALLPGLAVLSVENTGTDVVKVLDYRFREVGTTDTHYFMLVPVGAVDATVLADTANLRTTAMPMDTTYGSLSQDILKVYTDVPLLPSGSPPTVVSGGSGTTPKDLNYLHTRDFLGPVYRTFLPEFMPNRLPDPAADIGQTRRHGGNGLGIKKKSACPMEGIAINPGQAVALVSAAETAFGVQAGWSGWHVIEFAFNIDVEPQYIPTITFTGLKNPSEVRVFGAGTQTEVAGSETITSGTWAFSFDPDVVSSIDISILSLGYQNTRLLNYTPSTVADTVIPIQQVIDRQYLNP